MNSLKPNFGIFPLRGCVSPNSASRGGFKFIYRNCSMEYIYQYVPDGKNVFYSAEATGIGLLAIIAVLYMKLLCFSCSVLRAAIAISGYC